MIAKPSRVDAMASAVSPVRIAAAARTAIEMAIAVAPASMTRPTYGGCGRRRCCAIPAERRPANGGNAGGIAASDEDGNAVSTPGGFGGLGTNATNGMVLVL